jgi:REP element-mobilizing transposase RayT/lambda repressor-like predicted transcriptional regulator
MPRKSRIDAPGALHHIIARGIDRGKIFQDPSDKRNFLNRLAEILKGTETRCYAWALIPNHFHLLLRAGTDPVATVMRRLLTGHALWYNRRHRRYGHLFQNRYKSILCQEDAYLLELVRYIHLNPLRARLVEKLSSLDKYSFSGHSVLMDRCRNDWQDTGAVLGLFGEKVSAARRQYRGYVQKGICLGKRDDLIGGGLIRSNGGWANVKAMRRAKIFEKADERILGDGDFVQAVLAGAEEKLKRRYALQAKGVSLERVADRVAELMNIPSSELWMPGKYHQRVRAKSLLCYWANRELGISMAKLSRRMNVSVMAISYAVQRGEKIAREFNLSL